MITCSLEPVPLPESTSAQYEALSYVWGDPAERNEILLDGQPTSITRNLWTALKHIRKPDAARDLWVDAVCINQNDVQERNEQVRQMGRIYSQAERVLIWLGSPDAEIEKTLSTLSKPGTLKKDGFKQFPKDIVLGIRKILSQPWWHRMWVLQEHILSADLMVGCGCTWIEWEQLSKSILHYSHCMIDESGSTIMDESSTWVKDPFAIMRHILLRKQWNDPSYIPEERATIAEIVERTRGYQATDKRDQVFAIRDLLRKEDKALFPEPDYTRSASEVYQEAMVAFLRSKKNLAFLIHAFGKKDDTLGLPSWCVDFSKTLWDWGTYGNNAGGGNLLKGKDNEEEVQEYMSVLAHDASLRTLKVLGSVLGQVLVSRPLIPNLSRDQRQITAVIDGREQPLAGSAAERLLVFSQFVKEVLRMSSVYCKVWEDRHDVQTAKEKLAAGEVWETIFGSILFNLVDAACIRAGIPTVDGSDRPREYWVVEAFVRLSCPWYADALKGIGFFHPTPELSDNPELKRALWETLMLVTQVNVGNWWFATDTGYVACVEQEVEENDQLCNILGCRLPLVLRPCEGGYKLIAMPQSHDFVGDHHRKRVDEVEREVFTLL